MAKVLIKKMHPFISWDASRQYGEISDGVYGLLEMLTGKRQGGFIVSFSWQSFHPHVFASIDDALSFFNEEILSFARANGYKSEKEKAHA